MEEYRVIRSARKTLSLEITEDLTVLVRAPYQVSQSRIKPLWLGSRTGSPHIGSAAVSGRSSIRSQRRRSGWTASPVPRRSYPKRWSIMAV